MKATHNLMKRMKSETGVRAAVRLAVLAMLLVTAVTLTARAHSPGPYATDTTPQPLVAPDTAPSQLTIRVSSEGVTPTSATVSAGIVHLKVENPGKLEHLTLRVSRDDGELVREIAMPEKVEEWGTELELKAGRYVLTMTGNTSWSCHLTAQ